MVNIVDQEHVVSSDNQHHNERDIVLSDDPIDIDDINIHQDENIDANEIDVYDIDPECIPSPHGTKYYVPNVPAIEKPKQGHIFATFDEALKAYTVYAAKARFGIRKSGTKKKTNRVL